ncbi:hypothetical protein ACT6QH_12635 [Xanthobacter sp. TB0139]|uniref:hypothetical protein n=1 Tax=Xanthobacter sp. TB0139 TaxID=3459178 RepID=UPI00403A38ED
MKAPACFAGKKEYCAPNSHSPTVKKPELLQALKHFNVSEKLKMHLARRLFSYGSAGASRVSI